MEKCSKKVEMKHQGRDINVWMGVHNGCACFYKCFFCVTLTWAGFWNKYNSGSGLWSYMMQFTIFVHHNATLLLQNPSVSIFGHSREKESQWKSGIDEDRES